jgi:hypothetical protein
LDEWPVILEDENRMLELLKHASVSDYMQIWMPLSKDSNSDKVPLFYWTITLIWNWEPKNGTNNYYFSKMLSLNFLLLLVFPPLFLTLDLSHRYK